MAHKHHKHKMVRSTLLKIAKEQNQSFAAVKQLFVYNCDPEITTRFWQLLKIKYPNHNYTDVYHCPGCGKFDLE